MYEQSLETTANVLYEMVDDTKRCLFFRDNLRCTAAYVYVRKSNI